MSHKIIFKGTEGREKIIRGINTVADAVSVTLGPRGRCVIMEQFGSVRVTKDGVSVAKSIDVEDKTENLGVKIAKTAGSKTADTSGDGTTTAIVLLQAMVNEGKRYVDSGANVVELVAGMRHAVDHVEKYLDKVAHKVSNNEELVKQVATISANGDAFVGDLVAKAITKIGNKGVITVEDGRSIDTTVDIVEGLEIDRGFISPHFANNEKQVCELDNPYILLYDKKIAGLPQIIPLLEAVVKSGRSLLILCEDLENPALTTIVVNTLNQIMKVAAVKAPGFGDRRKEMMEDIAILTGGQVISEELGRTLEKTQLTDLGQAKKVTVYKDRTVIVSGERDVNTINNIETRCKQIEEMMKNTTSDYDREKLEERRAKLSNGVAVLNVGGDTEVDQKEKKDRVEDAVQAVKAAIEGGIIPGGGVAFTKVAKQLEGILKNSGKHSADFLYGVSVIANSILAPLRKNLRNANSDSDAGIIIREIQSNDNENFGFDVKAGEYVDMKKAGIIDPKASSRSGLQFASSLAISVLMSEAVVSDVNEKTSSKDSKPDMGGMY